MIPVLTRVDSLGCRKIVNMLSGKMGQEPEISSHLEPVLLRVNSFGYKKIVDMFVRQDLGHTFIVVFNPRRLLREELCCKFYRRSGLPVDGGSFVKSTSCCVKE